MVLRHLSMCTHPNMCDYIKGNGDHLQQLQPEEKDSKLADTTVVQAAVKEDEQPKPMAVTPVRRRKYKTKSSCPVVESQKIRNSSTNSQIGTRCATTVRKNKTWLQMGALQRKGSTYPSLVPEDDGPRRSQCPELKDHNYENDELPADPESVGHLLLHLDP
ncbi:hypothetical protein HGM15179_001403, partial [Zosterops borbonicus]